MPYNYILEEIDRMGRNISKVIEELMRNSTNQEFIHELIRIESEVNDSAYQDEHEKWECVAKLLEFYYPKTFSIDEEESINLVKIFTGITNLPNE